MTYDEIIEISKEKSISELRSIVGKLLLENEYNSIFCRNQRFEGLFRARKHNRINGYVANENQTHEFKLEKEYWNPSSEKIKYLGRCNDIGQSMFYATNDLETAVIEVRPNIGEFITVAQFVANRKGSMLPSFRIKPIAIQHLQKIKGITSCINDYDIEKRSEEFKKLDNFLDRLFTEIIQEGQEFKYKITNAITQCMLTDIVNSKEDSFSMNGVIYPSIARNKETLNILLKPIYAINNYQIESVRTFLVKEKTSSKLILDLKRIGQPESKKDHPSELKKMVWKTDIPKTVKEIKI